MFGIDSVKSVLPVSSTIDEQSFSSKTRCSFMQFMPSKPDKYGQKFWLAVDRRTKRYLMNVSRYLCRSGVQLSDQMLSKYTVIRFMQTFLTRGINVKVDNYLTSQHLAKQRKKNGTSLLGFVTKTGREI